MEEIHTQLLRDAAAAARVLDDAATMGPWDVEYRDDPDGKHILWCVTAPPGALADHACPGAPLVARTLDAGLYSQAEADVAFAAAMRPAVLLVGGLFETALVAGSVTPELLAAARSFTAAAARLS